MYQFSTLHTPEETTARLKKLSFWRRSTFLVMLIGYMGYYLGRANLSAAFPLLQAEFGYTHAQLGMIAAISELSYALGKFINGPMADKIGGKKIFLIGLAGAIVFNLIFMMGSTLLYFILVWCGCRFFLSMGWGGLAKVIGNWYPPNLNGTVMGMISINFQFGGVVAALVAGTIVSLGFGWKAVFWIPAILMSFVFVYALTLSKNKPQDLYPDVVHTHPRKEKYPSAPKDILKRLIRIPMFWKILLFSFLTTFLRSVFFTWTPMFLVDQGMETGTAILRSALFPFLGCLGTLILGWYTDRHLEKGRTTTMAIWLIVLSGLLVTLGFLLQVAQLNFFMIMTVLSLCGFFLLGPYSMSSGALTLDIAGPEGAGTCTGMIDGVGYIGGFLAAWGAGYISQELGWTAVFWFLGFFAILSALTAYSMKQKS